MDDGRISRTLFSSEVIRRGIDLYSGNRKAADHINSFNGATMENLIEFGGSIHVSEAEKSKGLYVYIPSRLRYKA